MITQIILQVFNCFEHYETKDAAHKGNIGRQKRGQGLVLPNKYLRDLSKISSKTFMAVVPDILSCKIGLKAAIENCLEESSSKAQVLTETFKLNKKEDQSHFVAKIEEFLKENTITKVTIYYEKPQMNERRSEASIPLDGSPEQNLPNYEELAKTNPLSESSDESVTKNTDSVTR